MSNANFEIAVKAENIQNMLSFLSAMFSAEFGVELSGAEKIGGTLFCEHISKEISELVELFHREKGELHE